MRYLLDENRDTRTFINQTHRIIGDGEEVCVCVYINSIIDKSTPSLIPMQSDTQYCLVKYEK